MGKAKPDILQGTLDLLVLDTLARGKQHGYGIAVHIQQVSNDALRVEEGSLYPACTASNRKGGFARSGACREITGRPNFTRSPRLAGGNWRGKNRNGST